MQGAYRASNLESLSSINKTVLDVDEIAVEFTPTMGVDIEFYRIVGGVVQGKTQSEVDIIIAARIAAINTAETSYRDAEVKIKNITGWATWTESDLDNWVTANVPNVTDLPSAKNAIDGLRVMVKAMGRAIIYLRDYVGITR